MAHKLRRKKAVKKQLTIGKKIALLQNKASLIEGNN